jgi:hypothetical protein
MPLKKGGSDIFHMHQPVNKRSFSLHFCFRHEVVHLIRIKDRVWVLVLFQRIIYQLLRQNHDAFSALVMTH